MNWKLKYTNQALKFLEKTSIESIDPTIRKAIGKVMFLENANINIRKMKGYSTPHCQDQNGPKIR